MIKTKKITKVVKKKEAPKKKLVEKVIVEKEPIIEKENIHPPITERKVMLNGVERIEVTDAVKGITYHKE